MTTARGAQANPTRTPKSAVRLAVAVASALAWGSVLTMSGTMEAQERQPPVSISTPGQGQEIAGHVSLWASADFAAGIISVRFQVDGKDVGQPITSFVYRTTWDSTKASDGPHTVQAIGQDRFGNTHFSQPITFFVNNFAQSARASALAAAQPPMPPQPTSASASTSPSASAQAAAPKPIATPVARPAPVFFRDERPAVISCKEPDPFKNTRSIGICVGGEWVLLWKPRK